MFKIKSSCCNNQQLTAQSNAVTLSSSDQFDPKHSGSRNDRVGYVKFHIEDDARFGFFHQIQHLVQLQPGRALLVDAQNAISWLDASGPGMQPCEML